MGEKRQKLEALHGAIKLLFLFTTVTVSLKMFSGCIERKETERARVIVLPNCKQIQLRRANPADTRARTKQTRLAE